MLNSEISPVKFQVNVIAVDVIQRHEEDLETEGSFALELMCSSFARPVLRSGLHIVEVGPQQMNGLS